ncbi:MAG: hypothetical protein KAJ72_09230, partial [Candidatus Heimdallarchaeota archaeon]|nr:hypothetical protein [Candidatus Heimdallarchaeota archaeon]
FYGMAFNEVNLTRLPLGEYRMWMKIRLMFGRDVVSNAVTLHVFENETFVVYDILSESWGNVSLFRSCLFYYLFGGVMINTRFWINMEKGRRN